VKRLLAILALIGCWALPHGAQAQTKYQTCAFSDPTHCYGIGPGSAGQAYASQGPSGYPAFSSSLSGVTSVNGSTIPAAAGTLPGSTGSFTIGHCLEVGSISPLEVEDSGSSGCGGGGGGGVSSFTFTNGNGFTGTVSNPTTTPALSLAPSFTGWAYSNGTGLAAAVLTGDCSLSLEAITCTETNGTAFSSLATLTPGTGVGSALGANVGSPGAFVVFNGPGGTPSSITLTNAIGTASGLNIGGNAATATNLASYPTLCTGSQFSQGLSSGSNNCATPTGGGNVSTSGSPVQYETAAFASTTSIEGIGPGTSGQAYVSGGASAYPSFSSTLSDVTSVNGTTIPASASLAALGTANTWAAAQTFPSSDIIVKGSSTGTTTLASANSSASNYTITWPANTGTVGELNLAQTWSALQTFGTDISIGGVTPSGATGTGNLVFGTSPTLTTPALGTPSALTLTNATGLPPTTGISGWPANASGVLTNNGSGTLSWGSAGSGTVTDGSGTTTANGMLASTTTAHVYSVVTLAPTLSISSGVLGETAPTRTVTSSPTVASTDMGGLINSNVSGGGTLTIPAISSSIFASGMTLTVVNYSASTEAVSTTPTVNSGGGCVSGTGIPAGDAWWMTSNGTTIDCIQTISTGGGGSGTVTTTGSPASTYLAGFSGSTSITGTANATLSGGALTLGVSGTLGTITMGNATSGTLEITPPTGALGTAVLTLPGVSGTIPLSTAGNIWSGLQHFTNSDLLLNGSSTGYTTFTSSNSSSTNYTLTVPANTGTIAELNLAQTFSAAQTNSTAGAASTSAMTYSGAPYTAGSTTTNTPLVYLNDGTAPTTWNANGTEFGANTPSSYTGNLLDFHVNGGSSVFSVNYQGNITAGTYNGVTIPATSSTALTSPTTTTAGQCQESTTTAGLGQWVTCSGGGTVTTTGSPASGELAEFSGSTSITNGNLSGDVTTSGTLAATVVAIKGIAVAVATASSSTSVTPNCTNAFTKVTASATGTFTINAPGTCTPFDGQKLELKIISPSGGTITYSWNAAYIASATLALPTTSNAASKEDYFAFQYDADKSGWVFLADNQGF
jgi:hypothetical protein